jgi:hypothetical protein
MLDRMRDLYQKLPAKTNHLSMLSTLEFLESRDRDRKQVSVVFSERKPELVNKK